MALRDKNGLTEAEFLSEYRQRDYPRPSFTVDVAVFACGREALDLRAPKKVLKGLKKHRSEVLIADDLQILLVKRGGHPFLDCWALPGGFVNPDEDADTAAARELFEETGMEGLSIEQFGVYSDPGRDPRGWTVSAAYLSCVDEQVAAQAGDDAADAQWCPVVVHTVEGRVQMTVHSETEEMRCIFTVKPGRLLVPRAQILDSFGFAFDHAQIVADALLALIRR